MSKLRHFFGLPLAATLALSAFESPCFATDIDLVALSNGKAMLVIDGKPPKNYAEGSIINGNIKLLTVDRNHAVIEVDGKKQLLQLGRTLLQGNNDSGNKKVIIQANELGHFLTSGQINGGSSVRMMIDTGATFLSLSANDAQRLGIDYKKGIQSRSATANGIIQTYRVKLDSVKIGDIEILQVEASVQENELPFALLGMSFLNRVTMVREGQQMTLSKKN